eukprot:11683258-Prorocentrum_lima.AAC.1
MPLSQIRGAWIGRCCFGLLGFVVPAARLEVWAGIDSSFWMRARISRSCDWRFRVLLPSGKKPEDAIGAVGARHNGGDSDASPAVHAGSINQGLHHACRWLRGFLTAHSIFALPELVFLAVQVAVSSSTKPH